MAAAASEAFEMRREPFWVTQKWDVTIGALASGILETFLPGSAQTRRARARLKAEIESLVQRNVENLRWATVQNIEETFRRFATWFDERLAETITATQGAIEAARRKRGEQGQGAAAALAQLKGASEWLAASEREIARYGGIDASDISHEPTHLFPSRA
jgi:hypothetical protein